MSHQLPESEATNLINTLKTRFTKNSHRHKSIEWQPIEVRLTANPNKLWSLYQMELTGGEPDVIAFDPATDSFLFCDCSAESPKERRSLCYDTAALEARKENKPKNSAHNMANEMGIEILDEEHYRLLQSLETVDTKTSSWLKTPNDVRSKGGALFGDNRYGRVFTYHNGADSYYAARGFRGLLIL